MLFAERLQNRLYSSYSKADKKYLWGQGARAQRTVIQFRCATEKESADAVVVADWGLEKVFALEVDRIRSLPTSHYKVWNSIANYAVDRSGKLAYSTSRSKKQYCFPLPTYSSMDCPYFGHPSDFLCIPAKKCDGSSCTTRATVRIQAKKMQADDFAPRNKEISGHSLSWEQTYPRVVFLDALKTLAEYCVQQKKSADGSAGGPAGLISEDE